jgi:hypothetical protein
MPYGGNPTVARFKTDMLDFRNQLAGSLEDTFQREADELAKNMKGAVPVLTGKLRDSIRVKNVTQRYGRSSMRVSFLVMAGGPATTVRSPGGAYDYALGTEFGTVKEKAEPFFYSTARRYRQSGRESAAETVDEAIAENNRVRELRAQNYSNAGITVSHGGRGGAIVI